MTTRRRGKYSVAPGRSRRTLGRLHGIAADPLATGARWRARVDPAGFLRRHARLARRVGIDRLYLVLSFDCDTAHDAAVVAGVHDRLRRLGVQPTYAVPGALLKRASDVYCALAKDGAEFLNHGGVEHTYFDKELGRDASCFFYDEIGPTRVRRDIEQGHGLVTDVLGQSPAGFRTPHFATYSAASQLRHLYSVLCDLGYRFSTSATPRFAIRHGPVSRALGLLELPVTGIPSSPFEILDTWAFFAAPDRLRSPADYVEQAQALASGLSAAGAGLINVYGDPAHIHDRPEFFEAVEAWVSVAEPISYDRLLDQVTA